jgi:hypothetical protein
MATGTTPFFGTLVMGDSRVEQRDLASHGVDLALELRIAAHEGEAPAEAPRGAVARAWEWLHALPIVGHRA